MSQADGLSTPWRVIVIDDHEIIGTLFERLMADEPDLELAGYTKDPTEAVPLIENSAPDVVVVDLMYPNHTGFDLIRELGRRFPTTHIVVLTALNEIAVAMRCLRSGAKGFICKNETASEIIAAIRTVAQGNKYLSRSMTEAAIGCLLAGGGSASPPTILSSSEYEVYRRIAAGQSTREISNELCRSIKTIETYRSRIKKKLGISTSSELTHRAFLDML